MSSGPRGAARRRAGVRDPLGDAFRDLFVEGTMLLKHLAREEGLSLPQLILLRRVDRGPPCRASDLAEELAVAPPAVTVLVSGLESRGWVTRTPSPEDHRSVGIRLTSKARRLLHRMDRRRSVMFNRAISSVSAEQSREIIAALRTVTDGLRTERTSTGGHRRSSRGP